MASNNTIWILGGIALGAYFLLGKKSGSSGGRTATLPVPYPNGTPTKIKESDFNLYGYVVDPINGEIYHSSQYPPPNQEPNTNWANWATMLQSVVNQGYSGYTAINMALAPSITVTPNWAANSYTFVAKDGFAQKSGTGQKGVSFGAQISNSKYYEVNSNTTTTVIEIKKLSDDSTVATKTINWTTKTVS